MAHRLAMNVLGNGLSLANHYEDALTVMEAELAMKRRLGADEDNILVVLTNLAATYGELGQMEKALSMEREVYSGRLKLQGEENERTLRAAYNYAASLYDLQRFAEAKSVMRKTVPVARRILGDKDRLTLKMRWGYALSLYKDAGATLDDLREAVTTLEDTERIARRVLGGAHPDVELIEESMQESRAALCARETPDA